VTEDFTTESLPEAIRVLFELNNFDVSGPLKVHGAEVDLCARLRSDPFPIPIYIEATVEYVNNEKYGKDATKFLLLREQDPSARLFLVSSRGFSLPVRERAAQSRVELFTYDALFKKFQQYAPYVSSVLHTGSTADELARLEKVYEEPDFKDMYGNENAIEYLKTWRDDSSSDNRWLIVVGEYGTGKTALTKVLLRQWMLDYWADPSLPIPMRIELRDITRQFNARGLLHHFLDHNNLSHITVDFILSLLHSGKIVLLLDGYDEMAQYMHARERRVCLEALAQLSADGAKGILTSRPNYFAEAEELQVLDVLYSSLAGKASLHPSEESLLREEQILDQFLQSQFLARHERTLRDLTPSQTEALVKRILVGDPHAQEVVLSILGRVFRETGDNVTQSLSGKPVIITYLVDIAEGIQAAPTGQLANESHISEWEIYSLILDNLMVRDFRRAPELSPNRRREFLRGLSVRLSSREHAAVTEDEFIALIRRDFRTELRRTIDQDREAEVQKLFADLRSSATLTRSETGRQFGWLFSHNSLREFLAAEALLLGMHSGRVLRQSFPVSDAMRQFVASQNEEERRRHVLKLVEFWPRRGNESIGQLFALLWPGTVALYQGANDPIRDALAMISGPSLDLDGAFIDRCAFHVDGKSANLSDAKFSDSILTDVEFTRANCERATFEGSLLDGVSFKDANIRDANFEDTALIEVNLTGADVTGARFLGADEDMRIHYGGGSYSGKAAIGLLSFLGGVTDQINDVYVLQHRIPGSLVTSWTYC